MVAISYNHFLSLPILQNPPGLGQQRGKDHTESKDQTGVFHPNPNLSYRCVCLTPHPLVPVKSTFTHPPLYREASFCHAQEGM